MKESTLLIIKIGSIIAYLFLAIGLEQVYRKPLFTQSIRWQKEMQADHSQSIEDFFKAITHFGGEPVFIPLLILIFLWFPINKSFTFLCSVVYSAYFDNIMKLMYGQPRPFWIDPSVHIACDGGYGTPSGHAFSSTTTYLAFWHIITDYEFFKKSAIGIILRVFILLLFIGLIFAICISRVFLGVHAVDQILFGASLGFAVYYIIFHIFAIHHMESKFFFNLFKKNMLINIASCWFTALLLLGFLLWGFVKIDNTQWEKVLVEKCPHIKSYRKYKDDALYGFLTLFTVIGAHYGLIFLAKISQVKFPNKEYEINHWYRGDWKSHIYRVLLTIVFIIPVILVFAIPGNINLGIIFTFKVSFPYLILGFNIFGPLILSCILLKIANKKILEQATIPTDIESHVVNLENVEHFKRTENGNTNEVQPQPYISTKN
jgi:membrane-associated phospholipid phosphatase